MSDPGGDNDARRDFAQLALTAMREKRDDHALVLDEDRFQITATAPDGKANITFLGNFYDEYRVAGTDERRNAVLDRLTRVSGSIDSEESLDEIRVLLRPRIRTRRHFEVDSARAAMSLAVAEDARVVCHYQPLASHLGVAVAIDRPEQIQYVMDPAKYGPVTEIEEIARINLARMPTDPPKELRPGIWVGHWNDDYAAERMLLPNAFRDLGLDGDPVVFLPGAEIIFVVGSNDHDAQRIALVLAAERASEPRGLVDFAFVNEDGTWAPFEPTAPADVAAELERRIMQDVASTYAAQKELLDLRAEGNDDAPFIPKLMTVQHESGAVATMTTWVPGLHAWLPTADHVLLARTETPAEPFMVPWKNVVEVCGDLLVPVPNVWPPRWEVRTNPNDAQMTALAAREESFPADEPAAPRAEPAASTPLRPGLVLAVAGVVAYIVYRLVAH